MRTGVAQFSHVPTLLGVLTTTAALSSIPCCGGSVKSAERIASEEGGLDAMQNAGVADGGAAAAEEGVEPDASRATATSCATLVLAFVGCDDERREECEREYAAVSAPSRDLVDVAVACLERLFPTVAGATWPAPGQTCSPMAIPPILNATEQWYHGACQTDDGRAENIVSDPGFPTCSNAASDAGEPICFFGSTL